MTATLIASAMAGTVEALRSKISDCRNGIFGAGDLLLDPDANFNRVFSI